MYGAEPQYIDLQYNDLPNITLRIKRTKRKISSDIMILLICSHNLSKKKNKNIELNTTLQ